MRPVRIKLVPMARTLVWDCRLWSSRNATGRQWAAYSRYTPRNQERLSSRQVDRMSANFRFGIFDGLAWFE